MDKSFGELIRQYQREGYNDKESLEKAYRTMYPSPPPKIGKIKKKKKEKVGE